MATNSTKKTTSKNVAQPKKVSKAKPNKSHKKKSSSLLTSRGMLLLVLAVVLVVGLFAFFNKKSDTPANTAANSTGDASLSLVSSSSSVAVGDKVHVLLYSNSDEVVNNAVQAVVKYPTDKLQLVTINSNSSAYPIKAAETNANGTATISRGVIGGVKNKQLVTDMEFVAKASGKAQISYDKSETFLVSADTNKNILSNDGYSTARVEVLK